MTNHAQAANRVINTMPSGGGTLDQAYAYAQVHATLALVEAQNRANEQQRIANLIALSQSTDGNGWQAQEPLSAIFTYTHPDPEDGFEGLHIRPEIAAALGITEES